MINIDWGILGRQPNIGQSFQAGYEGARLQRRQQATEDALAAYGANPAAGAPAALWSLDPQAAALASKNSREVADQQRAARARQTYAGILRGDAAPNALAPMGTPSTTGPAAPGAPAIGSPVDANGDILVTAPTTQPEAPKLTVADLAEYDPKLASELTEHLDKLSESDRDRFAHRLGVGAAVAMAASDLPYEQRAGFLDTSAPLLRDAGWTREQIAEFDPTDDNIRGIVNIGVGADKILSDKRAAAGQSVTMRGQDISSATARRGQDISASTARRGQDISAATARAGQAVTMRGQDMAAAAREAPKPATVQLAKTKIGALTAIENQLDRVESALRKAKYRGPVAGRLPGGLSGADGAADAAIRQLAPLVRQLTRVPGEGAMSDYESRLAEAGQPSRTQTPEALRETLSGYRDLIRATKSGYQDILGQPAAAPSGFRVVR